jgi:hypothetical protein
MATENSPEPGTPEYDAAMIALSDERLGNNSEDVKQEDDTESIPASKPEGVPDKYWNTETGVIDYASWNTEMEYLQKKASGKTEDKVEDKDEDKPEPKEGEEEVKAEDKDVKEAEKVLEEKGLEMTEFNEEFAATGELSKDSYDKLDKAGIPESMVNAFIAGQEALANQQRATTLEPIGGEEEFTKMTSWMAANLKPEEMKAYNEQVATENLTTTQNAISNMYTKYTDSVGVGGELIGGSEVTDSNSGFSTRSEMTGAINDKRYGQDPQYTKQIEDKLKATPESFF